MRSKMYVFVAVLIFVSLVLGACQQTAAPTPEQIVVTQIIEGTPQTVIITATPAPTEPPAQGPKTINLTFLAGDIPTLDPAISTDTSSIQIVQELLVGLTRLHEVTNETEPGIATEWTSEVTEDGGEVITFTLRDDVPWVRYNGTEVEQVLDCEGNPRMVNANDVYYGLIRTLTPATASDYAYVLHVIEGAAEFNTGETEDPATVGVEVIDDQTIQLRFIEEAAFNVQIAGMWVAYPQPQWLIEGDDCTEARGDRWTETGFNQSFGPYALKEWIHDSSITIIKNPFWPGTESIPSPKIEEATWTFLEESAAFAEYEAGNMDAVAAPLSDIDRIKSDPELSQQLTIAPNLCTYYYGFNTKAPYVDDVRVRRALSMAVDRQGLIDNVLKGEQQPAQWFSRPGLAGSPDPETHPDLGIKSDPEAAVAELQSYLDEKGMTVADLDNQITLMFNTSSGHQRIAEAIQQMWADTLGFNVQLVNQEWKVYLETTISEQTPQVWRMGWCIDYPDANNFVSDVTRVGGHNNPARNGVPYGGFNWVNEEYEALLNQARTEKDPDARVELYAQAEDILVNQDAAMIPIYWYTRVTLTKPYVQRTFGSGGQEAIEKWDILPH